MAPATADTIVSALDRLAGDGVVGLACSGGGDSLALLLIASRWARQKGRAVHVFTVNHGLRAEADHEVLRVARTARRLGWPCEVLVWNAARRGAGLQARAREARHRLLARACRARQISQLMLAHTRDDQVETVCLRLAAGGSWRSAAAMAEVAPSPAWPDGRDLTLLRPCLGVDRESLRQILRDAGEPWIEDPSNDDLQYARIRTRRWIGALEQGGLDTARLASLASEFQGLLRSERAAAWQAAQSCVELEAWGGAHICASTWSGQAPAIRLSILDALVMAISGEGQTPNRSRLAPLDDALLAAAPFTGCGVRLLNDRKGGSWMIRDGGPLSGRVDRPEPDPWSDDAPVSGEAGPSRVFDGRFEIARSQGELEWRVLGKAYQHVPDRAILDRVPGRARAGLLVGCRAGEVVEIAGLASLEGPLAARSLIAHRFCRRLLPQGAARWFDEPDAV
ncbi:tRNA lysidine(34) synthetase TilS [Maricaulis sp.]|uniref:tRNA lysidine(34) synthetase TilS n=1 Tax=Maricaulis sp. TaxID=1486257 RepID=UPI0025BAAF9F|nr:tRNA lysidine(34) synthetase TilS [Maricaulis sp.]